MPETRLDRSRERYRRLVEELRAAIVSGRLTPGAALDSEHALAARYGLGRNTVRRGLAALADEGLVAAEAGRGRFVTAPSDPASRAQTLQLAVYYPSAQTARLGLIVRAFEEANPLIRVRPLRLHPLGYPEAVRGLIESGAGPDLLVLMNGMLPELQPRANFLDLGDFLAARPGLAADLYPLPLRLFRHGGRPYALPFVFSPIVLAYDRAALAAGGVPEPDSGWTRDDLLDAARRLTRRGAGAAGTERVERYGFHLQLGPNRWPALVYAGGAALATADGTRGQLSTPAGVAALQFLVDLTHRHGVTGAFTGDLDGEALFVLRRAAMVVTSYYGADLHQFGSAGIDWDVALVPGAGGAPRRHLFQSTAVAVSARSRHRESALRFLEFVASPRIQRLIHLTGCSLPVRASVAAARHQRDPRLHPGRLDVFREAMAEDGDAPPFYTSAAALAAHRELLLAFGGMEDVATAARRADRSVEAVTRRLAGRAGAPAAVPLGSQDA